MGETKYLFIYSPFIYFCGYENDRQLKIQGTKGTGTNLASGFGISPKQDIFRFTLIISVSKQISFCIIILQFKVKSHANCQYIK